MNAFAIAGLFVLIPCIIVGIFTLLKGRKKIHFIWSGFCFSIALWGFGMYKIATTTNFDNSFFWWRIAEIGVVLIPLFLTHFVITFLGLKRKFLVAIFYTATAFFIFCDLFTKYFISDLYFAFGQFYYILATPIYSIFICIFGTSVVYVLFELGRAYKKTVGIFRYQIRYLILAFSVGFIGGVTSYFPVYKIPIYPVWNATIFISAIMATYAILRYRLMDLRIVARKITIYFISAGFVYGMFYLISWLYNKFFGGIYNNEAYILGFVVAPLFVLLFVWLNNGIKGIANKYLFFSLYSHQETIARLTDELTNSIDLNKIVDSIVNSIKQSMQLDRAGLLMVDQNEGVIKYKIAKVIGFNENNGISLVQDNFLTRYLEKTQKPLVRDEMQMIAKDSNDTGEKQSFSQLLGNMKHIEASLCLPMIISGKLIGIIVLGSKVSDDAYTKEDLDLLATLSKQAAIAIDNARLYKEVQDFNKTLQQKVDEQTKEIRQAYEIEKKAKEDLQKLDEQKNEFMMITQHHLRTPLTSMIGYVDLIDGGSFGKVPKKLDEVIHKFGLSSKNLIKIVNEFLDLSQFQMGKKVISLKEDIDIRIILDDIVKELSFQAENKGINLTLEKPKEDISLIKADPSKLQLAFTNVIDNSIKYTEKGGVIIQVKNKTTSSGRKIEISVKDTGIGMEKKDIDNLFSNLLVRGEGAKKVNVTGRGIGMYLSAKIIEAHNGKIWAESEGVGKGSTFFVELPVG